MTQQQIKALEPGTPVKYIEYNTAGQISAALTGHMANASETAQIGISDVRGEYIVVHHGVHHSNAHSDPVRRYEELKEGTLFGIAQYDGVIVDHNLTPAKALATAGGE